MKNLNFKKQRDVSKESDFLRNVLIWDLEPNQADGKFKIEADIEFLYAFDLLLRNSEFKEESEKTYKIRPSIAYGRNIEPIILNLEDVLSENWQSPYGEMGSVDKSQIKSWEKAFTPYCWAIDYGKLYDLIYEGILLQKEKLFKRLIVINMPPYVHELTSQFENGDKKSFITKVDKKNKILVISRKKLSEFPNPDWPRRCMQDILIKDKWKIYYENYSFPVMLV